MLCLVSFGGQDVTEAAASFCRVHRVQFPAPSVCMYVSLCLSVAVYVCVCLSVCLMLCLVSFGGQDVAEAIAGIRRVHRVQFAALVASHQLR